MDAPTLECYKYDGYAKTINVLKVNALEEAEFHYSRSKRRHSSDTVVDSMLACSAVHALTTTNILLEVQVFRIVIIRGYNNHKCVSAMFVSILFCSDSF